MTSIIRHYARAALILAALAVVFVVPLGATHLACEHADDLPADQHQCAVCRHLDDGTPLLSLSAPAVAMTPVADVDVRPTSAAAGAMVPVACGRAPPANDPVS